MSWRTVVVTSHCKLEYKMGYLVYRGETTRKVHLSEISTLIIETPAVSFTAVLMCELIKNKINVIFCDECHNPQSQLLPFYGSHDCSKKLKLQQDWPNDIRIAVWTQIVKNKIYQQAVFLKEIESEQCQLLFKYLDEIVEGDITNREGHSAKVYFNALFGQSFSRSNNNFTNSALNYGYTLLLSLFNRTIVSNGYSTQLGLFHRSEYNQFNFASDLMEPFRVIVDRTVYFLEGETFSSEHKRILQEIFHKKVKIVGKEYCLTDAVAIYCKSVFDALNRQNDEIIVFYEL